MMRIISSIFLLMLMAFGISFAILNADSVVLNYYFGQYKIPLSELLVLTFALGASLGFILLIPSWFRLKRHNAKLRAQIKQSQTEVDNLRSIPIRNTH